MLKRKGEQKRMQRGLTGGGVVAKIRNPAERVKRSQNKSEKQRGNTQNDTIGSGGPK